MILFQPFDHRQSPGSISFRRLIAAPCPSERCRRFRRGAIHAWSRARATRCSTGVPTTLLMAIGKAQRRGVALILHDAGKPPTTLTGRGQRLASAHGRWLHRARLVDRSNPCVFVGSRSKEPGVLIWRSPFARIPCRFANVTITAGRTVPINAAIYTEWIETRFSNSFATRSLGGAVLAASIAAWFNRGRHGAIARFDPAAPGGGAEPAMPGAPLS
jgi:hypothetical protein